MIQGTFSKHLYPSNHFFVPLPEIKHHIGGKKTKCYRQAQDMQKHE